MSIEFTLQPQPRFKVDVAIPRAGLDAGRVTFTFKHMPLNEMAAMEKRKNQTGLDFVESITDAWALPDDFTRDNLTRLANNYPQALEAIITTFYRELLGDSAKKTEGGGNRALHPCAQRGSISLCGLTPRGLFPHLPRGLARYLACVQGNASDVNPMAHGDDSSHRVGLRLLAAGDGVVRGRKQCHRF